MRKTKSKMKRKAIFIVFSFLSLTLVWVTFGPSAAARDVRYTVTDLGIPEGVQEIETSKASAINNLRQIVGYFRRPSEGEHAFIWDATRGMVDLGTFGGIKSFAAGINDRGEVVGSMLVRNSSGRGSSPNSYHAFLWRKHIGAIDLHPASAEESTARKISNKGAVIGRVRWPGIGDQGFLWEESKGIRSIAPFSNGLSGAYDIHDNGEVVGSGRSQIHAKDSRGFRRAASGEILTFPPLKNYQGSSATALGDSGMVYGHCTFPTDGGLWKVPVQWENGSVYELEYLGNSDCEPNAVNSKLQLVGMARWKYVPLKLRMYEWKQFIREKLGYPIIRTGGFPFALREKAVLWEEGEIYNLNDLILPEPSWILQSATDINDHGQIVGYGSHEGKTKAFLLTPIKKSGEGG